MRFGRYRTAVVLAIALCAAPHPAAAQQRTWHASGQGSFVIAADCQDCGEDIGIMFECRGLGRPADVSVPAVAVERRPGGRRHRIEFFVDGLGMAYDAEVERQGLVGYVPTLSIRQDDPLIERLAGGTSLRAVFAGRSSEITLRGARAALAAFASQCAWRNAKALARPLETAAPAAPQGEANAPRPQAQTAGPPGGSGSAPPAAADRPMRWQFYAGRAGEPSRLIFGAAGSDDAVLVASCLSGATQALVELHASPAGLEPGRPVEVGVHTSRGIKGVRGVINQSGHTTFASQPSGTLWSTLQAGGAATFSVEGRPAGFVESKSADRAITNFLAGCK